MRRVFVKEKRKTLPPLPLLTKEGKREEQISKNIEGVEKEGIKGNV